MRRVSTRRQKSPVLSARILIGICKHLRILLLTKDREIRFKRRVIYIEHRVTQSSRKSIALHFRCKKKITLDGAFRAYARHIFRVSAMPNKIYRRSRRFFRLQRTQWKAENRINLHLKLRMIGDWKPDFVMPSGASTYWQYVKIEFRVAPEILCLLYF